MSKNLTEEETERVLKNMLAALNEIPCENFLVVSTDISNWVFNDKPSMTICYRPTANELMAMEFNEIEQCGVSAFYKLAEESSSIDFNSIAKLRIAENIVDFSAYMPELDMYLVLPVFEV